MADLEEVERDAFYGYKPKQGLPIDVATLKSMYNEFPELRREVRHDILEAKNKKEMERLAKRRKEQVEEQRRLNECYKRQMERQRLNIETYSNMFGTGSPEQKHP